MNNINKENKFTIKINIIIRIPWFYISLFIVIPSIIILLNMFYGLLFKDQFMSYLIVIFSILLLDVYIIKKMINKIKFYCKIYFEAISCRMEINNINVNYIGEDSSSLFYFECKKDFIDGNSIFLTVKETFHRNPYKIGDSVNIVFFKENNKIGWFIDYLPMTNEMKRKIKKRMIG